MSTFDRLERAEHEGKGIRLSPSQVTDILDEVRELELMRELDAIYTHKLIEHLTGEKSTAIN